MEEIANWINENKIMTATVALVSFLTIVWQVIKGVRKLYLIAIDKVKIDTDKYHNAPTITNRILRFLPITLNIIILSGFVIYNPPITALHVIVISFMLSAAIAWLLIDLAITPIVAKLKWVFNTQDKMLDLDGRVLGILERMHGIDSPKAKDTYTPLAKRPDN